MTRFLLFFTSALVATAQQPATQNQFEVVSIRPSTLQDPKGLRVRQSSPRTLDGDYPLSFLVQYALAAEPFQIVGAPAWVDSANYAIVGKTTKPVAPRDMWALLLPVLQDRFQLKFHRENKEMQVFELSISKGGKLSQPQPQNCWDSSLPRPAPTTVPIGQRSILPCGETARIPLPGGGSHLYAAKVSMATLVAQLIPLLKRPIVDKTAFLQTFDFELKFEDELSPVASGTWPNIVTALQDQLGMKVKSAKDPVEVIVIDRLERPTEN